MSAYFLAKKKLLSEFGRRMNYSVLVMSLSRGSGSSFCLCQVSSRCHRTIHRGRPWSEIMGYSREPAYSQSPVFKTASRRVQEGPGARSSRAKNRRMLSKMRVPGLFGVLMFCDNYLLIFQHPEFYTQILDTRKAQDCL